MVVLFDFGEVLGLPQTSEDKAALATAAGVDPGTFERRYWAGRHAYDSGDVTDAEYWSAIAGRELVGDDVTRLTGLDTASWLHLSEDVLSIHADLVARGIPTALFSNAPDVIADAIDGLAPFALMHGRYFSSRLRLAKPDRRAFHAVVSQLDRYPREVVFVDDRPVNVAGARDAGLQALEYTDPARLRADLADLLGDWDTVVRRVPVRGKSLRTRDVADRGA